MKLGGWILPAAVVVGLIGFTACSGRYQPPTHTFTGAPQYAGVGVSVWGGMVSPVVIGGPVPVAVPESRPDVDIKVQQMPLDPIF